jgi:ABC-type transporter Mla subunit MlaD
MQNILVRQCWGLVGVVVGVVVVVVVVLAVVAVASAARSFLPYNTLRMLGPVQASAVSRGR